MKIFTLPQTAMGVAVKLLPASEEADLFDRKAIATCLIPHKLWGTGSSWAVPAYVRRCSPPPLEKNMIKQWTKLLEPLKIVPPANLLDSHDIVLEDFLASRADSDNEEEDTADVQARLELGTRWI